MLCGMMSWDLHSATRSILICIFKSADIIKLLQIFVVKLKSSSLNVHDTCVIEYLKD